MRTLSDENVLHEKPEAILDRLMREYGTKVLRLVYLFVKDRALAEDIAQDVFVKVYRHLADFRQESAIQTWLYRITVNECRAYLRSWSFRRIFPKARVEQGGKEHVEAEVLWTEQRENLLEQVLALPPAYRQVIALHYYEDLDISEIASILQIREGAVRTRLHRARQMLKQSMEKEGGIEWIGNNR